MIQVTCYDSARRLLWATDQARRSEHRRWFAVSAKLGVVSLGFVAQTRSDAVLQPTRSTDGFCRPQLSPTVQVLAEVLQFTHCFGDLDGRLTVVNVALPGATGFIDLTY
jgi:hypothetical protein